MDMIAPPAPADPGKYLLEQTPVYVASLIALRDELAKRQGALSAVEKTAKLKQEAEQALETAREQADALLTEANTKLAAAKKREADLREKGRQLDQERTAFEAAQAKAQVDAEAREPALRARQEQLAALEAKLLMQETDLKVGQVELGEKVRALQAKVAALAL